MKIFVFLLSALLLPIIAMSMLPSLAQEHPTYIHARSDLRAARWLIDHHSGAWVQNADEAAAVRAIDAAIAEIQKTYPADNKNINDHPQEQEIPDRAGRIRKALELLQSVRKEINEKESSGFAQGLKTRVIQQVDGAISATQRAAAVGTQNTHPAYLVALSNLRAARWLIDHHMDNLWRQSEEEANAIRGIDAAIDAIKQASIDDGKDIDDHPQGQEIRDRSGRLRRALELLKNTKNDLNQKEDNNFSHGLKMRALQHIDEAIRFTDTALRMK